MRVCRGFPACYPQQFFFGNIGCTAVCCLSFIGSVRHIVRVREWSNQTYFNNFHAHDGDPPLDDLACNTFGMNVTAGTKYCNFTTFDRSVYASTS
jgi:hypothetical protein